MGMPDSAAAAIAAALASASRRWMHFSLAWGFSPQSHLTWDERFLRSARQCGHWVMGRPFLGTKKSSRSGMSIMRKALYILASGRGHLPVWVQPLTR